MENIGIMKKTRLMFLIALALLIFLLFKDSFYYGLGLITLPKDNYICNLNDNNLKEEYASLLAQVGITDNLLFEYDYSRILYHDIYDYNNKIVIYHGDDKKYEKNMAVINDEGLVGIISKVNSSTSEVTTINNNSLKLSVKVGDIYGVLSVKNKKYMVLGLDNIESVNNGDEVFTSGLGHVIGGLKVGTVINKGIHNSESFVEIIPSANLQKVHYIIVIKETL